MTARTASARLTELIALLDLERIELNLFRASGRLPDDAALHQSLLVYESDNALLSTARLPHRGKVARERLQVASLDHAMWFHQPALDAWRADRWLLYALDSPSSSAARGYNRGRIFTERGVLVAGTMQEGLMRPPAQWRSR